MSIYSRLKMATKNALSVTEDKCKAVYLVWCDPCCVSSLLSSVSKLLHSTQIRYETDQRSLLFALKYFCDLYFEAKKKENFTQQCPLMFDFGTL